MRTITKTIVWGTAMLWAAAAIAEVYVTNVVCTQRYPWNGMVDIDYEVVCDDAEADVWVYCTGKDGDMNMSMAPRAISGEGADGPVKAGLHRMTWNVTEDYPGFASTSFTVQMCALTGGAPYMVVDLSGGVDALEYPVEYLNGVPEGGWTDEYKTDKMVLRLIPPGTFMMGSPTDELGHNWSSYWGNETLHQVTLTKPFYIGVFEVTQRQYELVMGSNPSNWKESMRPVEKVSYNDIRGTVNGAAWPTHSQVDANSFMGRLRSKANMMFDLPTESQWEYACRAGTETALNSGKNLTGTQNCNNMAEVGWYSGNAGSQTHLVGQKLANTWGLYDMHGNVAEWCLDWMVQDWGTGSQINPKGASSGSFRVVRGGCWYSDSFAGHAAACRSSYRTHCNRDGSYYGNRTLPDTVCSYWGFRICCLSAE